MAKKKPPTPRPQGPTTSLAFASRIRTAQQGPNMALARGMGALLPGAAMMLGAMAMRPNMGKRKERGR